jgi:murein L,D-transpeptidase YafK
MRTAATTLISPPGARHSRRDALKPALAFLLLLALWGAPPARAGAACRNQDARIVVELEEHTLVLCERAHAVQSFGVRLGRAGTGKSRAGDGKTPVGTYPLGRPRASSRYGTFIPIGYPTAEQRKQGLTGGAVGVHGPERRVKWLGRLVNTFDTSDGCVGLAKDEEMERIAQWVRSARARTIELR